MTDEPQAHPPPPRRIFSGIQPTGEMHLGNYLGAVQNWVALQDVAEECFICIVDYHALTSEHDPARLASTTLELAIDLLACGIDPEKSTLFVQSQLPEHTELTWILSTVAAYGDLSRMTQFKEKGSEASFISAGLFLYPVLQAADILLYRPTAVPVGQDQEQHLELTRSLARRFNSRFTQTFPEPSTYLTQAPRIMSPADPERKMSKSLGPKHCIGIFEPEAAIRKKIRSHVTDTGLKERTAEEIPPGVQNLLTILKASAPSEVSAHFVEAEKSGRLLYKDLKPAVADHVWQMLEPIQERRRSLERDYVLDSLVAGAARAREVARHTLQEVRERIGLLTI